MGEAAGRKKIFWEVDMQRDFVLPGGKLYAPGAEKILPNVKRLVDAALKGGAFLVSSADAHPEGDAEFARFPPHCLKGSEGARIVAEGLAAKYLTIPNDAAFALPGDFAGYPQIVIEKQTLDVFGNVHTDEIVERLGAEAEYTVFGVVTEYCVKCAAAGLLRRGRKVSVVTDAIEQLEAEDGRRALGELQELGARLVTTDEALAAVRAAS